MAPATKISAVFTVTAVRDAPGGGPPEVHGKFQLKDPANLADVDIGRQFTADLTPAPGIPAVGSALAEAEEEEEAEDEGAEAEDTDFESWSVAELREKAEADGLTVKRGRGEDGPPVKEDYVRVLRREERKARKTE